MKKLFAMFVAAITTISMFAAADVVLTSAEFNGLGTSKTGSEVKVEKDGVTFLCDKGFGDQYGVRCYKNSVVTISAEKQIGKIVFEFATVGGTYYNGELDEEIVVDALEWKNTMANQARMNSVSIYFGNSTEIVEKFDTLTVAQAIEKAKTLADNTETTDKFFIEGYAVNVVEYSALYGNQDFYLVDDLNNPNEEFMAYRSKPTKNEEAYPVLAGDQVRVFGKIKKYVKDGTTTLEVVNPSVEFLKEVEGDRTIAEVKVDTITVAKAVEIGKALADGKSTAEVYVVKGYACTTYEAKEGYTDQTWYMADEPDAYSEFQAFRCTPDRTVVKGDFMYVRGNLLKYVKDSKVTIEISNGTATHGEAPVIETVSVDVAKALEIGNGLADNAYTNEYYAVTGYVTKAFEFDEENLYQNFYMADKADDYGDFYAFKAKPEAPVEAGYKVILTGKIKKYVKDSKTTIEIENGKVEVLEGQGIENVVLTEKAKKVVVDGVLYIIRDNKMYDVRGTQVR